MGQIKRSEVEELLTWDLSTMFKSDEDQEKARVKLEGEISELTALKGTLGKSANHLLKVFEVKEKLERALSMVYTYAHLKSDQDTADSTYQAMMGKAMALEVKYSEAVAYVLPEILSIPRETVEKYMEENEKLGHLRHYFERLFAAADHTLSEKEEMLLAGAGEIFAAPMDTAFKLINADLKHGEVTTLDGSKARLTNGLYMELLESDQRELRKEAYEMMYTTFGSVANTLASTLTTNVKNHNYIARVKGYSSAREASLSADFVPESVYDTLVEAIHKNLGLLQKYLELRKKALKLDTLRMYDVYTPIVGKAPIKFTIEEAKEITLKALAPLGEEYISLVKKSFDERWIDWIENEGKRGGAYSAGCYDSSKYILMNWRDSLDQLFTLVHELGHSLHSHYTHTSQTYAYGNYPIFLAEIASTTNENLLTEYLLANYPDPDIQKYVLNHYLDGLRATVFRQTQFAEFEHFIHEQDAAGVPLTHEFLTEAYGKLNAKYYSSVEQDDFIAKEWLRIPHFYFDYYVFQYATGFSAATALSSRILSGNPEYIEAYYGFLKAGISQYPIDVMKAAGVDMTKVDYIEDTMKVFERRLEELEALLG